MRRAILGPVLLSGWLAVQGAADKSDGRPAPEPVDQCVACHLELGGDLAVPVKMSEGDVHRERGLGCADCHGGDSSQADQELAMDPKRGFVGRPKPMATPAFCGKCHSDATYMKRYNPSQRVDQETEYYTSGHGKRLKAGDTRVATCVNCHGSHGIRPQSHPLSQVYAPNVARTCGKCHGDTKRMGSGVSTSQFADYSASVHADALYKRNDLSAPTCNDCHGNHGAAPPGAASVANVCGSCHSRQAELFRKSPHSGAFQELGLAECVVCHENHRVLPPADKMLAEGSSSACTACHLRGDPGFQAAARMKGAITGLDSRLRDAERLLERAERAGMEVSRARFAVSEGRDSLVNLRVLVHSFSPADLEKEAARGLATAHKSHGMGEAALDELQFRRKGLAASLLVIACALVAVYLKIRQIERK